MTDYDVVVVGAGVVGCVVARDLAVEREVCLVDRGGVAGGATGRAAGLIAPTLFFGDLPDVARYAGAYVRDFDGTGAFSFTGRHRFDLVTPGGAGEGRGGASRLADEGFPVEYWDAADVEEAYPAFDLSEFDGAVRYRDTGWVDPHTYAVELSNDARDRGAVVRSGVDATGIGVRDGAIEGIETAGGTVTADAVVVAAGWRTPGLLRGLARVPVRPYRTQCVVLEPGRALAEDFPLVRAGSMGLYLRPEHDGDLLVGGGTALVDDPEGASPDADEGFRAEVAAAIPGLLPGIGETGFVDGWAGVDGATPDARPIVDAPPDAPDGLVVATGFNGLGVMAAPVVGPAVRELLGGDAAPFDLAPFSVTRFDSRGAEFDLRSTSDL